MQAEIQAVPTILHYSIIPSFHYSIIPSFQSNWLLFSVFKVSDTLVRGSRYRSGVTRAATSVATGPGLSVSRPPSARTVSRRSGAPFHVSHHSTV